MVKIRRVAQSCYGRTYMHAWAKRYGLKRALQWSELRKCEKNMITVSRVSVCAVFAWWTFDDANMQMFEIRIWKMLEKCLVLRVD